MGKYKFETSKTVEDFFDKIVEELIMLFNISEGEAVGRVNQKWSAHENIDNESMIFHMIPEEWAYEIYYGPDSIWWKKNADELQPLPYTPQPTKEK